uniref:hypothetical protein n=1 Tax=Gemmiger qucibialis TaxID=2997294 RepID=UPI003FEFAA01
MKLMLAQNTAQQRAATRTEQQAQRRAAACKNALAARRLAVYQARRTEWQANPCADGKGAGEKHPRRCVR